MLSAACLLIVASCKKDNKTDDDQANDCQLTESVYTEPGDDTQTSAFTYNAEGKVTKVKVTEEDVNDNYEITYTYSGSKITAVDKDRDGSTTSTYNLDAKGRIASETYGNGQYTRTYTYNTEGYIVEHQVSNVEGTYKEVRKYNYTNGNLTSIVYGNGATDNLIYGTELAKDNFVSEREFVFDSPLRSLYGKTSKNLIAKFVESPGSGGVYEEAYTYEKDAKGNITKVSVLSNDGDSYMITSKYNCK